MDKPLFTSFHQLFYNKLTLAKLLFFIITLCGIFGYNHMIKEANPDLNIPSASITTVWQNSDSYSVEQNITNTLEKEIYKLSGIKKLVSSSYAGKSVISVEFLTYLNTDESINLLKETIAKTKHLLPKDAEEPMIQKFSINNSPIIGIKLFGSQEVTKITALGKDLQKKIESIAGVNEVNIDGAEEKIIQIILHHDQLINYHISPVHIKHALQQTNKNLPLSRFNGDDLTAIFRFSSEFKNLAHIKNLPIKTTINSEHTVYLKDVATVIETSEDLQHKQYFAHSNDDFQNAITISVSKQTGADAVEIIDKIKETLHTATQSASWDTSIEYAIIKDESEDIKQDLGNIFHSGWQAMLAVFLMLLIFLSWREAIVASIAVPVSFAGAIAVIAYLGHSLNEIVIIGMVIALGLMVDVFILMMEGMHENVFKKQLSFLEASKNTLKTYAMPAFSGQLTTIVAMIPLLGVSGVWGKFIRPMPITVITCLISAYLVALFIALPLSSLVFRKTQLSNKNNVSKRNLSERNVSTKDLSKKNTIDMLTDKVEHYVHSIIERFFIAKKWLSFIWVIVAISLFALSFHLFSTLPSELMPMRDGKKLGVFIELEPNNTLASATKCADAIGNVLIERPYLSSVSKYVGKRNKSTLASQAERLGPNEATNYVSFSANFTPFEQRNKFAYQYYDDIKQQISTQMNACVGAKTLVIPTIGGGSPESPLQIEIKGNDIEKLREYANEVMQVLTTKTNVANVRQNLGVKTPEIIATPQRDKLVLYDLSEQDLASQVNMLMTNTKIADYKKKHTEEPIAIKLGISLSKRFGINLPNISQLNNMHVITNNEVYPLTSLVNLHLKDANDSILHINKQRTITINADVYEKTSSSIVQSIRPELSKLQKQWQEGYSYHFAGEEESSENAFGSAKIMLILAICLVFFILIIQFDSFTQPIIILFSIPLALIGTFTGFYILNLSFSFMAIIGIISLVGIVVNDTIVMIDTMNTQLKLGKTIQESAVIGASKRIRPIFITSITTIISVIPLSMSSPMWFPLGTTIISGLLLSTLFAIFITPCLFVLLTHKNKQQSAQDNKPSSHGELYEN